MKFLNEIDSAAMLKQDPNNRLVSDTEKAGWDSKASGVHKHTKSDITDFPTSMPANGGNASTVNGKTVDENVPAGAKFTDTIVPGAKGDKGDTGDKGESGVYVGSGDMPEYYNVQIDPNGDGETLQDMIDSALLEAKNSGEFKGNTGEKGEKGTDGKDGYTPQKGVDYYTDADKAEMVSAVLAALPVYEGEVESV